MARTDHVLVIEIDAEEAMRTMREVVETVVAEAKEEIDTAARIAIAKIRAEAARR